MSYRFAVAISLFVLAPVLAACGVYGPKGNDTGGIIPWSPESERTALSLARDYCGAYNKHARISSVRRVYGDYIVYECQFDPPRYRRR